ncbi:hypothetical protein CTI12_AA205690 [Artemisia annua]|uniref:Uncharacterized protein n=1 Tax=Artemisia annua TaxID=35608 RepID=A0A2U1P0V7_ARTAN|nr:hypothetical protein CTI12_AA205690 [Artemisia annua]
MSNLMSPQCISKLKELTSKTQRSNSHSKSYETNDALAKPLPTARPPNPPKLPNNASTPPTPPTPTYPGQPPERDMTSGDHAPNQRGYP